MRTRSVEDRAALVDINWHEDAVSLDVGFQRLVLGVRQGGMT
jgi:hypothetical protein